MRKLVKMRNISACGVAVLILISLFSCRPSEQETKKTVSLTGPAFTGASTGLPSSGLWRNSLAFLDMNRDGHMDIVAPPPRKGTGKRSKPLVWYGDGKGKWAESPVAMPDGNFYAYGSIAVSDFTGDGIEDIFLAPHSNYLKAFKGIGSGIYEASFKGLPSDFMSRALVAADFNNDGISDVAALSEAPFSNKYYTPDGARVCFFKDDGWNCVGVGNGNDVRGLYGDKLVAGDVNHDGNMDIAVASLVMSKSLIVWLGDGKGGFKPFNKGLPQEMLYFCVSLGDLNQDGRDDLVAGISGTGRGCFVGLRAFLSGEEGFTDISDGLPGSEGFQAVRICDVDKDGQVEIIAGTDEGGIKLFSRKSGRWEEIQARGVPKEGLRIIMNLYCVDLNADGYEDIVVNYGSERFKNGGIQAFFNVSQKKNISE